MASFSLYGETERRTYSGKLIVPRPNIAYEDSSEVLREGKTWYGHAAFGLIATEVSAGYFLNPDTIVGGLYMVQQDTITGISRLYSVSLTRFTTDTLYLRGGVAARFGDVINYINSIGTSKGIYSRLDYGLEMALGNRWQWDSFSLGAEWIAIYFPLLGKDASFDFQFRTVMVHFGIAI